MALIDQMDDAACLAYVEQDAAGGLAGRGRGERVLPAARMPRSARKNTPSTKPEKDAPNALGLIIKEAIRLPPSSPPAGGGESKPESRTRPGTSPNEFRIAPPTSDRSFRSCLGQMGDFRRPRDRSKLASSVAPPPLALERRTGTTYGHVDGSASDQPEEAQPTLAFRVVLASDRATVQTFFLALGEHDPSVAVTPLDIASALSSLPNALAQADCALIDVAPDTMSAIRLCQQIRAERPEVPLVALTCCPRSLTFWHVRALVAAGVGGVLDFQATREEALRALRQVARGDMVLHLELGHGHGTLLREILAAQGSDGELRALPRREVDIRLLELVALGLSDQEIGERLHLSHYTVKHHIEHLRDEVQVRNRVELAAWAGVYGLYDPDEMGKHGVASPARH